MNACAASGDGRAGRARDRAAIPLSIAGLLAIILVMAGQPRRRRPLRHARARRPRQRLHLRRRRFDACDLDYDAERHRRPGASATAERRGDSVDADRHARSPRRTPGRQRPAGRHDPAVGRQGAAQHPAHRQRPAAGRRHAQHRHAHRRVDRPGDQAGRDVQPAARHGRRADPARTGPAARSGRLHAQDQRLVDVGPQALRPVPRARATCPATTASRRSWATCTASTSSTSSRSTSTASRRSSTPWAA